MENPVGVVGMASFMLGSWSPQVQTAMSSASRQPAEVCGAYVRARGLGNLGPRDRQKQQSKPRHMLPLVGVHMTLALRRRS